MKSLFEMAQGKNWCFTLNNYSVDEESEFEVTHDCVTYIIFGKEKGESGTPHLQGYLEFSKNMRISAIKKLFNCDRLHLEKRIGTSEQAANYCRKEGRFYERGAISVTKAKKVPAAKNKLLAFIPMLKEKGIQELSNDAECNMHLLKHAMLWNSLNISPRKLTTPLKVIWYYGETGTGKTWKAYHECLKIGEPFIRSGSGRFFDGYDGQKCVIFDDFREDDVPFNFLLRLLDRYPLRVEIKGGTAQWKAELIYITAPFKPEETFTKNSYYGCKDNVKQLLRRLNVIEEIVKEEDPQTPQGGLNIHSNDLVTPPKFLYPIQNDHSPLQLLRSYCRSLPEAPSPTQDFLCPDSV